MEIPEKVNPTINEHYTTIQFQKNNQSSSQLPLFNPIPAQLVALHLHE